VDINKQININVTDIARMYVFRYINDRTILYKLNLSFRNQRVKLEAAFIYRTENKHVRRVERKFKCLNVFIIW